MSDTIDQQPREARTVDPPLTAVTRDQAMTVLRENGVPDDIIGQALGLSRQRIHKRLGPRPAFRRAIDAPLPEAKLDDLPAYLKDWRDRNGLSIAQAANLTGTTRMNWQNWERGEEQLRPRRAAPTPPCAAGRIPEPDKTTK